MGDHHQHSVLWLVCLLLFSMREEADVCMCACALSLQAMHLPCMRLPMLSCDNKCGSQKRLLHTGRAG
jgi:hypothetical protein